ncbi:MAG TPA: flagellar protein FlbD [Cyanobacteria bacterium UBA8530]|nr:flagellar protein FlbD [Cyanobacteria bacterium UBA8530]
MIKATRLNGTEFYLNPELIETIEETPDTVVKLTTGQTFVVRDSAGVMVERFMEYKKAVYGRSPDLPEENKE